MTVVSIFSSLAILKEAIPQPRIEGSPIPRHWYITEKQAAPL